MTEYKIWKPEYDGHAPPNWRDGMAWDCEPFCSDEYYNDRGLPSWESLPSWERALVFRVPPEALTAPNEDAKDDYRLLNIYRELKTQWTPDELAKHGITLAPERDWATELWAETFEVFGKHHEAARVRNGALDEKTLAAIQLLRTRFEQMKGDG